jgi:ribosomal protein L37E
MSATNGWRGAAEQPKHVDGPIGHCRRCGERLAGPAVSYCGTCGATTASQPEDEAVPRQVAGPLQTARNRQVAPPLRLGRGVLTGAAGPRADARRGIGLGYGLFTLIAAVGLAVGSAWVTTHWWSAKVASFIDGSASRGVIVGAAIGFAAIAIPLLVLRSPILGSVVREAPLFAVLLAVAFALPNVFTAGIVLRLTDAARAAGQTLDVQAPGFRTGTLVGVGLVLLAWIATEAVRLGQQQPEAHDPRAAPTGRV